MSNIQLTRVVNVEDSEYDVFIGRPSKWGNPFKIGPGKFSREESLERYKDWILGQAELIQQLDELKGKVLGCYCKPKACHGDTLSELVNKNSDEY